MPRPRKPVIPVDSREVIRERAPDGKKRESSFYIGRQFVGRCFWDSKGVVSLEYGMKNGRMHGTYREWYSRGMLAHERRVYEEGHYKQDLQHGIFRIWNDSGSLRRGYPKYFVIGQQVQKRQYLRACLQDDSLPKFIEAENRPVRKKPRSQKSNLRARAN